eukprot:scaffold73_cov252-Pinguiococcus_pyrenoidosus.AAC.27
MPATRTRRPLNAIQRIRTSGSKRGEQRSPSRVLLFRPLLLQADNILPTLYAARISSNLSARTAAKPSASRRREAAFAHKKRAFGRRMGTHGGERGGMNGSQLTNELLMTIAPFLPWRLFS